MCVQRVLPRSYFLLGLAISTAVTFGSTFEARAQADLNMQSRLDSFTPPFVLSPAFATPIELPRDVAERLKTLDKKKRGGACMSAKDFVLLIYDIYKEIIPADLQDENNLKEQLEKPEEA